MDETQAINLSHDQLRERRSEILAALGMTHREFVLKSMNQGLTEAESLYEKEIDTIDFLLGEVNVDD